MKQEHKQAQQTDKYVGMSTTKAVAECVKQGITKPSDIAKLTGKNINQIYTATWKLRNKKTAKYKSVAKKMPAPYASKAEPQDAAVQADWDREPTPFEEAHMVVMRNRADYESIIENLNQRINELLLEKQELTTIIKYLEGKGKNV